MAYMTFKLEGVHSADLPQESVSHFTTRTDTPKTNDGRGIDTSVSMTFGGPIRPADETSIPDDTIKLAKWATESDDDKAYSQATASARASSQVLRRTVYPEAFVVCYTEEFDIKSGVGRYSATIRQKKDLLEKVHNSGGYPG